MKLYKFESGVKNVDLIDETCKIHIEVFFQDYDKFDRLNIISDQPIDFNIVYEIFINFYVKSIIK